MGPTSTRSWGCNPFGPFFFPTRIFQLSLIATPKNSASTDRVENYTRPVFYYPVAFLSFSFPFFLSIQSNHSGLVFWWSCLSISSPVLSSIFLLQSNSQAI